VEGSAEQPDFEPVVLGRVTGLFGVRGWVKVWSYTEPREALLDYGPWLVGRNGRWRTAELAEGQRHGKTVIVRLAGIEDRDAAAELLESDIAVPPDALPEPEEGFWYWRDLEGLAVRRADGSELGTVEYVLETGANDVLVVKGDRERLIPFVTGRVILDVDLDAGVIEVDWEWD
jgi:16S rRNA processing protein RimM